MSGVFIVGSEGTTGLRLKERLRERRDLELIEISDKLRKDEDETARLMERADFTFLCLPDDAARKIAQLAKGSGTRIIDASTAHRTDENWVYGFPELSPARREAIADAARVSVPGCHAGGCIALVRPLVDAGLLSPGAALSCTSLTGYSGGGKKMIADYKGATAPESPMLYAMGQAHKHLPEIIKHGCLPHAPLFLPVVGSFYSGMLVTVPLCSSMLSEKLDCDALRQVYRRHYAGCGLVRVSGEVPASLHADRMSGFDDMKIFVTGSDGRFLLSALFDNLGKGASGSAIQCFNIMNGLPEDTGLVIS